MDDNGIITGKIPVSGEGAHKTYEDSMFARIFYRYFYDIIKYGNNGIYFDKETNELVCISPSTINDGLLDRIKNNPENYIKVVLINIINLPKDGDYYFVEFISQSSLHQHLVHEEEMRQNEIESALRRKL